MPNLQPERLCAALGHSWEPVGAHFYHVYRCERCRYEGLSAGTWRERMAVSIRILWQHLRDDARYWRQWIHCPDCAHWFGYHDESDHLPF